MKAIELLYAHKEKIKIAVVVVSLTVVCSLVLYFHLVLKTEAIISHLFYIPALLAAFWWKRKGLIVAIFAAAFLIISHIYFRPEVTITNDYFRALMLVVIPVIVAALSTRIEKKGETLRESEEKYRSLISSTVDPIILVDAKGTVLLGNDAAVVLLGKSRNRIVGENLKKLLPEEIADSRLGVINKVIETKSPTIHVDWQNKHYLESMFSPVIDERGKVSAVTIVSRDLTDRKRMEEAIERSEERYRTLFETAVEGILIADTETKKFKYANPAISRMLGYSVEELQGMGISDLHPKQELEHGISEFEALPRGEKLLATDIQCVRKDGTILFADIKAAPAEIDGVKCVIGFFTDVTERKQAEEDLRDSEEQLRHAHKMEALGRLASGVAHDFNNTLVAVVGFSDLALNNLDKSSQARGDIEEIKRIAVQAAVLSRQLLTFGRIQKLSRKLISPNDVVSETIKMLHRLVGEDVKIVTDLKPGVWQVNADPAQLDQVIMNFSINAREAMPDGGTLTIKTEDIAIGSQDSSLVPGAYPGRFVCLSVADTGIGLEKKLIEKIFEPYYTTKKTGGHSGLGLATVYGIVKQHKGWIHVYSQGGLGSVFKVYLPAAPSKDKAELKEDAALGKLQGQGERILLVEDETNVRKVTARMLRENGYIVFEAPVATEALAIFEKEKGKFDLIFSDVILPDQSGIALVRQLLAQKPRLKVLFSSGYLDLSANNAIAREKEYNLLNKPFTMETLLRAVKEVMAKKSTGTKGADRRGK